MSLPGNKNASSANRSSIFETFHTPNFGDEEFEVQSSQTSGQLVRTYSRQPHLVTGALTAGTKAQTDSTASLQSLNRAGEEEEEMLDDEEDAEADDLSSSENNDDAQTTLWMSCSPGRDFTDEEEEEEEAVTAPKAADELEVTEEDEEDEENLEGESSDDGLPLSKLAGKRFLEKGVTPGAKRFKGAKQSKGTKDKTAPKKPLSAYAFFYRDTQQAIKSQNPQASFGEISKIVASMWDRLDGELKEDYNKRADENRKEYLKKLAAYCAESAEKNITSAKSKPKKTKKPSSKSKPKSPDPEVVPESQDSAAAAIEEEESDDTDGASKILESSKSLLSSKEEEKPETPKPRCNSTNCKQTAVQDPRWDFNYCSSQCVILHCKDVFNAFVANRQSEVCET